MNPLSDQISSNVFIEGELSEEDLMKMAGGVEVLFKLGGAGLYTREELLEVGYTQEEISTLVQV